MSKTMRLASNQDGEMDSEVMMELQLSAKCWGKPFIDCLQNLALDIIQGHWLGVVLVWLAMIPRKYCMNAMCLGGDE